MILSVVSREDRQSHDVQKATRKKQHQDDKRQSIEGVGHSRTRGTLTSPTEDCTLVKSPRVFSEGKKTERFDNRTHEKYIF
jgi:hypothetical protein